MSNKRNIFIIKGLTVILLLTSGTLVANNSKPDAIDNKMYNNALYGSLGISLEVIGESWFTATAYYERMIRGKAQKSNISTFIKAGIGGAAAWEDSYSYILGQYGILTGVKKHHLEISAGLVKSLAEHYNMFPLSGSFGYRFQKPKGHFIFRTGVAYPEAFYFGLGVSF